MTNLNRRGSEMTKAMSKYAFAIVVALLLVGFAVATPRPAHATFLLWDEGVNHWEIQWKYTETDHFIIYWYPQEEYTARALVKIAEEVYEADTKVWNIDLKDKIVVTIIDTEDYSNGFAAHEFNWITIWASNLYFDSRGRTDWLYDVFSHEFGHICSLKVGNQFRDNMLGVLVGGMKISDKYAFDVGVGVMFTNDALPTWWVEGASQYSSLMMGADLYDTHREMLLRAAVLDDNMLTIDAMDIIENKNSLQAEMVYNQGMSMNSFLGEQFGLDAPARMWQEFGLSHNMTYNPILKREFGLSREELYNQWKAYVTDKYNKQLDAALKITGGKEVKGRFLRLFETDPPFGEEKELSKLDRWLLGTTNHLVKISPKGDYLSLISSHGTQRRGSNFYYKKLKPDPNKINDTHIKRGPRVYEEGYNWHPDGKKIVYAGTVKDPWLGYEYSDLQVYDTEKDSHEQITWQLRAMEPTWSPDGKKIAFILNGDGQRKLAVMNYPKLNGYYILIDFKDDTQLGTPVWSPDGSKLAFLMFRKHQQDIWIINSDGTGLRPVTYDKNDHRDPAWMDNETLVFANDRTGIFNIYSININTHKLFQITNVKTGAFMPWVAPDGNSITYSYFTSFGYRPYEISKNEWMMRPVEDFEFNVTDDEIRINLTTQEPLPEIQGLDYTPYRGFAGLFPILYNHAGTWVWIPIVNYEWDRLQMGAQMIMVDAVERNFFFAEALLGEQSTYVLYYENYMTPVTIFAQFARLFPVDNSNFQYFNFDVKAQFDASFYMLGMRYLLFNYNMLDVEYDYQDIRVEQPFQRYTQMTGRTVKFEWTRDTVNRRGNDGGINPHSGSYIDAWFAYGSPKMREPLTGAPLGTNLNAIYSNPNVMTEQEARTYPDDNYLLPQRYGFFQTQLTYRDYIPFPFWDLTDLNDTWAGVKGWDWSKLNFEQWKRQRHTLILKAVLGVTHSDVPEGYGWGNSYGRVNFYDRFHGGGMWVTALGAYSENNSAFLGYENYSLQGEMVAILGFDYRFPILMEIDTALWAFHFDKLYMSVFGDAGNLYSHPERRADLFNLEKWMDSSNQGAFDLRKDVLTDLGVELRLSMFLFMNEWDSFVKLAHGFEDPQGKAHPVRVYVGLGTGFDDRY
jgi:hypothetical protein